MRPSISLPTLAAALLAATVSGCRQPKDGADPASAAATEPAAPLPPPWTLDSGVIVEDLALGNGPEAQADSVVLVHYRGSLLTGEVFDETDPHGPPREFPLAKLIRGWQQGVPGMKVGGTRRLTIPAKMGYGAREVKDGAGNVIIPPNSELHFEITLAGLK